jgi:hypothetical protein
MELIIYHGMDVLGKSKNLSPHARSEKELKDVNNSVIKTDYLTKK